MSVETRPERSDPPIRPIAGSATGINHPYEVTLDALGDLYVLGSDAINVFARGADGNGAPIRSIGLGSKIQPRALAVDRQGRLYVASAARSIAAYAPGASGDATPRRLIAGESTGLALPHAVAIDAVGNIYVDNWGNFFGARVDIGGESAPDKPSSVTVYAAQ